MKSITLVRWRLARLTRRKAGDDNKASWQVPRQQRQHAAPEVAQPEQHHTSTEVTVPHPREGEEHSVPQGASVRLSVRERA
ncbi:MAG: hypothetical protein LW862_18270 [Rubrivivax sp.]|nr:hypothetical protein [Rubrivivax sp.]